MSTVGGVFGTVANKSALAEAERQLAKATNAAPPETVTVEKIVQVPCPTSIERTSAQPNTNECRGGLVLKKTPAGWESVLYGGRPLRCE
ncbi:MAG: hypothetical protein ABI538_10420 [Pseudoxanthomonas sp.]